MFSTLNFRVLIINKHRNDIQHLQTPYSNQILSGNREKMEDKSYGFPFFQHQRKNQAIKRYVTKF